MKKSEIGNGKTETTDATADWNNLIAAQWSDMLDRSGQTCAKLMTAWRDEMVGFAEKRLQADLDTMRDLAACRSWSEMMELQQSWLTRTVDHYVEQNGRLMERCRELAESEAAVPATEAKVESRAAAKPEARPEHRPEHRSEHRSEVRRAA